MGDELKKFLRDLLTLEITTRVGKAATENDEDDVPRFKPVKDETEKVYYTRIDLVDADIFCNLPSDGSSAEVRKLHEDNVKLANEMIERRIDLLERLANDLGENLKKLFEGLGKKPGGGSTPKS